MPRKNLPKDLIIFTLGYIDHRLLSSIGYHYLQDYFNVYLVSFNNIFEINYPIKISDDFLIKEEPKSYDELFSFLDSINSYQVLNAIGFSEQSNNLLNRIKARYPSMKFISYSCINDASINLRFLFKLFLTKPAIFVELCLVIIRARLRNFLVSKNNRSHSIDSIKIIPGNRNSKNILGTNSINYYKVLENSNQYNDDNYIVFIDDGVLISNDFVGNLNPEYQLLDKTNYVTSLNIFFDMIEKHYESKVIIAAHPDSKYAKDYSNYFNNRKIVYDNIVPLVRGAELCLSHYSTALEIAILLKKPIVLLDCNSFQVKVKSKIYFLSSEIGKKELNLNSSFLNKRLKSKYILSVDHDKYNYYIDKYILSNKDLTHPLEVLVNMFNL